MSVLSLLQADIQDRTEALSHEFHSAQPFRYVVIDDFVNSEFCRQLTAEFPPFDPKHAMNELGQVGGKAVFQNLPELGRSYARLDHMLRNREFLDWVGRITGIPGLLYDPEYIGGGTHENLEGQDLDAHVDFNYHPTTHLHRRLNLILFLNPEWREEWGGALELHVNPWLPTEENHIKTIVPLLNRCVIFETTENSWHGFKRISLPPDKKNLSRRSIAVYFYSRTRPAEETAPDHSTVYVPRPMPEHIRAGRTLTEEDMQMLRILMIRRDMQIQFLYDREKEFSRQMGFFNVAAPVLHSKSFQTYMTLTGPARKCWSWYKNRPYRKQFEAKASQS